MKFKILLFLIIVVLSVSGCTPLSPNHDTNNEESSQYQDNAVEFSPDDLINSDTKIAIYDISRDDFHLFIENPSKEHFRAEDCTICEYVEGERFFASSGSLIFEMNTEFVKFVNSKTLISDFLLEHNIVGEIEQVITFWAPKVPVTMWVKIDNENIFITVEKVFDESSNYQFSVINYNDYYQKYSSKNALLIVNGINVKCSNVPKIYGEYCEIPFLATLEALGATIKWKNENDVKIIYDSTYYFDIEKRYIYRWPLKYDNLLSGLSGTHFYYAVDKDIMIDNSLFKYTVHGMGKNVSIDIDRENNIISINIRQ